MSMHKSIMPNTTLTSWCEDTLEDDLDLRKFDMLRGNRPNLEKTEPSWKNCFREMGNTLFWVMITPDGELNHELLTDC